MASKSNSQKLAEMRDLAKFVDELYFSLNGLPPMSVFAGAWGYYINKDVGQVRTTPDISTQNSEMMALTHPIPTPSQYQFNINDVSSTSWDNEQNKRRKKLRTPRKTEFCQFCKNNGELERVYLSHKLKDNHNRVQCPRLRQYKCKICGESGDKAHTILHCPQREKNIFTEYFPSQPLSTELLL